MSPTLMLVRASTLKQSNMLPIPFHKMAWELIWLWWWLTAPFFSPTSRPSLPGGPPITLMYRISDSISHSFSFTLVKDRHCSLFSYGRQGERQNLNIWHTMYAYFHCKYTFTFILFLYKGLNFILLKCLLFYILLRWLLFYYCVLAMWMYVFHVSKALQIFNLERENGRKRQRPRQRGRQRERERERKR